MPLSQCLVLLIKISSSQFIKQLWWGRREQKEKKGQQLVTSISALGNINKHNIPQRFSLRWKEKQFRSWWKAADMFLQHWCPARTHSTSWKQSSISARAARAPREALEREESHRQSKSLQSCQREQEWETSPIQPKRIDGINRGKWKTNNAEGENAARKMFVPL